MSFGAFGFSADFSHYEVEKSRGGGNKVCGQVFRQNVKYNVDADCTVRVFDNRVSRQRFQNTADGCHCCVFFEHRCRRDVAKNCVKTVLAV